MDPGLVSACMGESLGNLDYLAVSSRIVALSSKVGYKNSKQIHKLHSITGVANCNAILKKYGCSYVTLS